MSNKIIDPNGNDFVIKGVNIQGYRSWEKRSVLQDVHLIADVWKFNTVRLNCFIGQNSWGDGTGANNDIDAIIKAFTAKKVVVEIDLHDTTGYPPLSNPPSAPGQPSLDQAIAWFKGLAAKYKDNPYVWFNTMNEPGSSTAPLDPQWKVANEEIIKAIRSTGADNIIVVDGWSYANEGIEQNTPTVDEKRSAVLTWGQDVLNADSARNTIFAFHNYNEGNIQKKVEDYINRANSKGLYVFMEEYGKDYSDTAKKGVKSGLQAVMNKGAGRIYWNWDGYDLYDLTSGTGRGSGWEINKTDGSKPTNLSWVGDKIWDDNHGLMPTFDDQNPKVDLALERLIANNNTFKIGDKVQFTTFLRNSGDVPIEKNKKVVIKFYVDGVQLGEPVEINSGIAVGQRIPVMSPELTVSKTDFTVKAVIDSSSTYIDGADDAVVGNNSVEARFNGAAPASGYDLVVTGMKITPDTVKEGDYVQAQVTVANQGPEATPVTNIIGWFYVNGYYYTLDDAAKSCTEQDNVILKPGDSVTLNTKVKYRVAASFNFSFVLESLYADDQNHSNNAITVNVPVKMAEGGVNLVSNPGFEDGLDSWQDWQQDMSAVPEAAHSGALGLKIGGGKAAGGGQDIPLKPNTTYILGAWAKFDSKPAGTFDVVVQYHLKDANNTYVQHILNFNETDWTYKQLLFTTPDVFGSTPQLALWKGDTSKANLYVDDVYLMEVPNLIVNGMAESEMEGWPDWGYPVSAVPEAAHGGTKGFKLSGGKQAGMGQKVALKPNTTYILAAWGKFTAKPNTHCDAIVQYHLKDANNTYVQNILRFTETNWTYKQVVFTTPDAFGSDPEFVLWKDDASNADFYADDITLVEVPSSMVNKGNGGVSKFTDISGSWAKNEIQVLASKNMISGYPDGTFKPDKSVTRAEFVSMLIKALGIKQNVPDVPTFSDVNKADWYYGVVEAAKSAGIASGYGKEFKPDMQITRQEMMVMVVNALKANKVEKFMSKGDVSVLSKFKDGGKVQSWAKDAMAVGINNRLIKGIDDKYLSPDGRATRAQAAAVIYRMLLQLGRI